MPKNPLTLAPLGSNLAAPTRGAWQVQLSDPARSVMTDFNEHGIVTVAGSLQVDEALEVMRHAGVRSAFITDEGKAHILGLITAYDIMGEKPLKFLQTSGGVREEVLVTDIMDRAGDWNVARIDDVNHAFVSEILDTFGKYGGSHLAVVEHEAGKAPRLRGVFSAAKLLRLTETARKAARAAAK